MVERRSKLKLLAKSALQTEAGFSATCCAKARVWTFLEPRSGGGILGAPGARRNLEEAAGKTLARRTGTAYEATGLDEKAYPFKV